MSPPDAATDLTLDSSESGDVATRDSSGSGDVATRDSSGSGDVTTRDSSGSGDVAEADRTSTDIGSGPDVSASDASSPLDMPGVFVAVGYGGRRVRSTDDGVTWTDDASLATNGGDDNTLLRTVAWGKNQFVALGYRAMTSPNGKDWQDRGLLAIDQWIGAALFAQGQFVAIGGYGLRAISPDGVAWTDHPIDHENSHADSADALVFTSDFGGRFVSTNDSGRRSTSTDGKVWTFSTGATSTMTTDLAFGNGVLVGIGGTAVVVSTDGGTSWSDGGQVPAKVAGLVFAQGHFTALASGHAYTSSDGVTWTDHSVAGLAPGALTYGHGTYIKAGGLMLSRSPDGISWASPFVLSGSNHITCVTFGPTG